MKNQDEGALTPHADGNIGRSSHEEEKISRPDKEDNHDSPYDEDRPSVVSMVKPSSLHVSDIHSLEIQKLRKRKYYMHVIMTILAIILIGCYSYFYVLACKDVDEYTKS